MTSNSKYHLQAVVDWVEVRIHVVKRANGGKLQLWIEENFGIRGHHLKPLDKECGSLATAFDFRIQDPGSWDSIAKILAGIEEAYGFAHPPSFTGIEVSMDGYIEDAPLDELAALTAHRYRSMHRPVSKNQRIAGLKGTRGLARAIAVNSLHRMLSEGRVVVMGEFGARKGKKADPITMRIYTKSTDSNATIKLPQGQWRSRWEITLRGERMPFASIEEAREFRFQTLSKFFYTRIARDDLSAFEERILDAKLQPGAAREAPILRRLNSSKTKADREANDKAYEALKKLTRHMNPKTRGGFRGAKEVGRTESPTL